MKKGNAKKKLILITYFLAVFVVCAAGYGSLFSPLRDTYGLSEGIIALPVFHDFFGMIDYCYISLVNNLYLYLGEKVAVIIGLHVVLTYISFLFMFHAIKRFYKPVLTYVVPFLVVLLPFFVAQMLSYDAFVLLLLFATVLFYLIVRIIFVIAHLDYNPENVSLMTESLSERELRESRKPKTIINDKGETIQLLANPLPGPKKHVKRTMDYDYQIPPGKMFYDIDGESVKDWTERL